MSQLFAKIRVREHMNKYRKLLYIDKLIYPTSKELIQNSSIYNPQTLLEDGEWYYIEDFSNSQYTIDIISGSFETVDFDTFLEKDFDKIDYIFAQEQDELYFQKINKTQLIKKRKGLHLGDNLKYDENISIITINEIPDAIYVKETDTLYFQKLTSITRIFKGIEQLYREATEEETINFLNEPFIVLKNGFSSEKVKKNNRKRIALAIDTLSHLKKTEQEQIFSYIGDYCPKLKNSNDSFEIENEEDLKMLLWGIEQRFYTTPIKKEKRVANSIITLE